MPRPHRLLVVEEEIHYAHGGALHAYGPYTREIDVWADLFAEVVIAAPLEHAAPPGDCLPFARRNITMRPQLRTGGDSTAARLAQLAVVPIHLARLAHAMRDVDAIHVRCPGNLPLLGALLAPMFSDRIVAKFTSQWNGDGRDPLSWRVQRAILRSRWFRGPVTVYGAADGQPSHVVPFFTSVLTTEQAGRARVAAATPRPRGPLHVLYVGRLTANKNVDVVLDAMAALARDGVAARCTVVGEGPERGALEAQGARLGIGEHVAFTGGLPFERVLEHYETADVLALVSSSEGWGKSLTEAMAFGLVCVGSDTGVMPQLLADGRGIVVPPRDVPALADALRKVASGREEFASMRARAAAWAQRFTLEGLRESLGALLDERWALRADESLVRRVEAFA